MKTPILFFLLLEISLTGFSQTDGGNLALKVGDKVPINILNQPLQVINSKAKKRFLTLSSYAGKAVILDFWGTWCGTCISRFPHVDSLAREYQNDMQFILVNTSSRDGDPKKVASFISKYLRERRNFSVPFVHQDALYKQAFFARALPHYVWIGKDGKVKAITDWTYLNPKNIQAFVSGVPLDLPVKLR
jgi:thiol-disulfide isomerase/thioredoxin